MKNGRITNLLQKRIFQLLIFFLPAQLGKHFWPSSSKIYGIRIDYLSPTVYLTDVLVFALLVFWVLENLIVHKRKINISSRKILIIMISLSFVMVNIWMSVSPWTSTYKWLKVCEFVFLAYFIYKCKKLDYLSWIAKPLLGSLVVLGIVYVGQLVTQRSLDGIFYLVGERHFRASTPGISLVNIFGKNYIRPYSTFSHPNSLAGFLLVCLFLLAPSLKRLSDKIQFLIVTCIVFGILFTFSLNAYITLIVLCCLLLVLKKSVNTKNTIIYAIYITIIIVSLLSAVLSVRYIDKNFSQSIQRRIDLTYISGQMIAKKPFFGVGLGSFVVKLPIFLKKDNIVWWLQPTHNIILLIFAETGLIGLAIFILLFYRVIKNLLMIKNDKSIYLLLSLLGVLSTGLWDHYWLTLQQNQLLLSIVLGLSFRKDIH